MRLRGNELGKHVGEIVEKMHTAMKGIKNEQTLTGTLHSFRTLSSHHLDLVATEILTFDIPHDELLSIFDKILFSYSFYFLLFTFYLLLFMKKNVFFFFCFCFSS